MYVDIVNYCYYSEYLLMKWYHQIKQIAIKSTCKFTDQTSPSVSGIQNIPMLSGLHIKELLSFYPTIDVNKSMLYLIFDTDCDTV